MLEEYGLIKILQAFKGKRLWTLKVSEFMEAEDF